MRSHLYISILFASIISCSPSYAAQGHMQKDPCDSVGGTWSGDFYDLNKQCGCSSYYRVFQGGKNVAFHLVMYNCSEGCDVPPDFNGICYGAQIKSDFNGGFSGPVYEGMMDLKNENYQLQLYK